MRDKLNYLFETVHPKDRGPWSHPEVHRATGVAISTLSDLRTGKNANPTLETLQRLARFFGVDPAYFFDTPRSDRIREQLDQVAELRTLAAALEDNDAELILARMSTFSPDSLREMAEILKTLRDSEK
ncbi:helix-turn-helix domain-containing protein [Nocardia pseudobrasiliensis]|uniref:Transcriptional regulator with XRE-family HTH domain n=1 Tax=Nocardia pseudobrasiliensis TaxID=45979 RepID=A0A370I2M2_9NOCA|nr:helix-turn-helix domain-containing protein [Nocardia pseudobrasiliensis]RDI64989.1 transcriptional regulator with XRE-family HTH domain [Nocardia pseudobrasiliensis]